MIKKNRNQNKQNSLENEARLSGTLDFDLVPASGATRYYSGDLRNDEFLQENKYTLKKENRLHKRWLDKIVREAEQENRLPCLSLTIDGRDLFIVPLELIKLKQNKKIRVKTFKKSLVINTKMIDNEIIIIRSSIDLKPWAVMNRFQFDKLLEKKRG